MHLQQTKRSSARSGGPQYYFHALPEYVLGYLRKKGAVRVALVTPYGATKSDFFAVGEGHKLDRSKDRFTVQPRRVGHDRIQAGRAGESIGEAIRTWFNLPTGQFERIDLEIKTRPCSQALRSIHQRRGPSEASGPLERLGLRLGPYVGKGYDCAASSFEFLDLKPYQVPVEVKKESTGFHYQQGKYGKEELSRAVILCMVHNKSRLPDNIDVIELAAFPAYAEARLGLRLR